MFNANVESQLKKDLLLLSYIISVGGGQILILILNDFIFVVDNIELSIV